VSPVILLVNEPDPEPFVVLELVIVGFWDVLQQTPRTETVVAQLPEMVPPDTALDDVILLAAAVVTVGAEYPVVKDI
jgi:hypothetical protein